MNDTGIQVATEPTDVLDAGARRIARAADHPGPGHAGMKQPLNGGELLNNLVWY